MNPHTLIVETTEMDTSNETPKISNSTNLYIHYWQPQHNSISIFEEINLSIFSKNPVSL